MINVKDTRELLELLSVKEVVVFGTGYVSESFWKGLENQGLTRRVSRFVVTKAPENSQKFHERPVTSVGETALGKEGLLCLAVHRSLAEELMPALEAKFPGKVLWIYPYLHEMIYGIPKERGVRIPRKDILRSQDCHRNWITIRYLTARDYLQKAADYEDSRQIYLKAMALHCEETTAKRRLASLEHLADKIAGEGYNPLYPIMIDTQKQIIDGLHRLSIASVLRLDTIPCDIVAASTMYDTLLSPQNKLPDELIRQAGFSKAQLKKIAAAKQELIESIQ